MKTAYYVQYYMGFANTYNLCHAPVGEELPSDWERITRKEAERLCAQERYARKHNQAFSGYGDSYIYPYDLTKEEVERGDVAYMADIRQGFYFDGSYIIRRK